MNARRALGSSIVCALLACASLCAADAPDDAKASDESSEPKPPVIVAVDFDAIPTGALPSMASDAEAVHAVPTQQRAIGVKVQKVKNPFGKKMSPAMLAKMGKTEVVELVPDHPEIAAMYLSSADGNDFEGESIQRMACHRKEPPSIVRWETLAVGADGNARLAVKDLWFDAESCTVTQGPTAEIVFKAIAWDGVKPWLFAMRDDKSVTFLMPRTSDVSADAMVGSATTVKGGFTRVTLPIGRWGSSSILANLATLELKAPPAPVKASTKGQAVAISAPAEPADQAVEIAVELVQTMSEKSPTVLVRRNPPDGAQSARMTID